MTREAGVGISLPQAIWALITSQQVRLWLTKKRELWCSPSPFQNHEGIFLQYLLWEPGQAFQGKSHNTVGASQWLGPLEF